MRDDDKSDDDNDEGVDGNEEKNQNVCSGTNK